MLLCCRPESEGQIPLDGQHDADAEPLHDENGDTAGGNDGREEPRTAVDMARLMTASVGMADRFSTLLHSLDKLETSVGDIQKYFHRVFREGKLDQELAFLDYQADGQNRGWQTRAAESIRLLFTIDKHQRVALAVRGAALAIHLSQPFPVVQRILSSSGDHAAFSQLPLKQVITAYKNTVVLLSLF